MLHGIEIQQPSEEFARCWHAAGRHIQTKVQGPLNSWLKANLTPPFLEHLSFRLGNQLFFIRIEDVDGNLGRRGCRAARWAALVWWRNFFAAVQAGLRKASGHTNI
jgi:hypothetical protein